MAWDDADPDGDGEPGDMRYDYKRTRERMEQERRIKRRIAEKRAADSGHTKATPDGGNGPEGAS